MDCGTTETRSVRHHAPTPPRGDTRRWFERLAYDIRDVFIRDAARRTLAWFVVKSIDTFLDEPLVPFVHGAQSHVKLGRNCIRGEARGGRKNDGSA
jgi:hypothetical protein